MSTPRTLFTVLLVFPSICCSPSSDSSRSDDSALPLNFKIEIAEGGGFTGMWNGFAILAGDSVLEWSGRPPEVHPMYAGQLSHDTTAALWRTIRDGHFMDIPPKANPGNYTRTLSITVGGPPHEFGWSPGTEADSVSSAILNFRTRCLQAIHQALGR